VKKTVYLYVNGILTRPGHSKNWTGRAVTWSHVNRAAFAEKVEYYTGPLTRVFGQKKRAAKLARVLNFYRGWRIVLVGHSNGCDVICDCLRDHAVSEIAELHLLSAACKADFSKNGLNSLPPHWLTSIRVYIAQKDWALKLASTWSARHLLGYGALGRKGPVNPTRRVDIVRRNFGHSDWFAGEKFDRTMDLITGGID
jgi:pimeloyl-ACP methyl ester carboxylesterase